MFTVQTAWQASPLAAAAIFLTLALLGALVGVLTSLVSDIGAAMPEDGVLPGHALRAALGDFEFERTGFAVPGLIGAAALAAVPLLTGFDGHLLMTFGALAALCVAISVMDTKLTVIPEELTWLTLFAGLLAGPLEVADAVQGAAVGCLGMWACLVALGLAKGVETRSGGDTSAAAAAGAWIGLQHASMWFLAVAAIYVVHAGVSKARGIDWVPLGPSLCGAMAVVFFWYGLPVRP